MSSGYDSDLETVISPYIEERVVALSMTNTRPYAVHIAVNSLCYKFSKRPDKYTLAWSIVDPHAATPYTSVEYTIIPRLVPELDIVKLLARHHPKLLVRLSTVTSVIKLPTTIRGECKDTTIMRILFDHLAMSDDELNVVKRHYTALEYRELLVTLIYEISE